MEIKNKMDKSLDFPLNMGAKSNESLNVKVSDPKLSTLNNQLILPLDKKPDDKYQKIISRVNNLMEGLNEQRIFAKKDDHTTLETSIGLAKNSSPCMDSSLFANIKNKPLISVTSPQPIIPHFILCIYIRIFLN